MGYINTCMAGGSGASASSPATAGCMAPYSSMNTSTEVVRLSGKSRLMPLGVIENSKQWRTDLTRSTA
eukprot:4771066-Pyramimonas_sp.AAC.1